MTLKVIFRPLATRDVEEVHEYYAAIRPALGQSFLKRVNESVSKIQDMPQMYAVVKGNVRAARTKQFPYVIYYRILADRVEVLTVIHAHREPTTWQLRVD